MEGLRFRTVMGTDFLEEPDYVRQWVTRMPEEIQRSHNMTVTMSQSNIFYRS